MNYKSEYGKKALYYVSFMLRGRVVGMRAPPNYSYLTQPDDEDDAT